MTTILAPSLVLREWDNNGNPLAGGRVFTYAAGTTTPQATFTDSTGVTPNPNPVTLNSRGEAQVWLTPNLAYKFVVQDSAGNQIRSVDQIVNNQLISLFGGVDTGTANTYVLSFAAPFTNLVNGVVIYWIPANTNTGASTLNVNSLGIFSIVNPNGSALIAGQITVNQPAQVMFFNGSWQLLTGTLSALVVSGNAQFGRAGANNLSAWGTTFGGYLDLSTDTGSWTTTLSGPYTVNPTGTLKWTKIGKLITVWCDTSILGTATGGAGITANALPAVITPFAARTATAYSVSDNGTALLAIIGISNSGFLTFNTAATAALAYTGITAHNFSGSGSTGINAGLQFSYSI